MNAQEAITYMEQYVKELDNLISHHKAHDIEMLGGDHFPETIRKRHKELDDKREAIAIVLESAKVLHEGKIEDYWRDGRISTKKFIVDTHPQDWNNIGIEEGAD